MTKVRDIYKFIDNFAPFQFAMDGDNSGLLIGDPQQQVTTVLLALDVTRDVLEEAVKTGSQLIITHHPVIFEPLKTIFSGTLVHALVRADLSVIAAHTNLDIAKGGVNDCLADRLDFKMREDIDSIGKVGILEQRMVPEQFAAYVCEKLSTRVEYCSGGRAIERVGICSGAGGSFFKNFLEAQVDAFVTGDVKYSLMLQGVEEGITIVDAGHFSTEIVVLQSLKERLTEEFTEVKFRVSKSEKNPILTK